MSIAFRQLVPAVGACLLIGGALAGTVRARTPPPPVEPLPRVEPGPRPAPSTEAASPPPAPSPVGPERFVPPPGLVALYLADGGPGDSVGAHRGTAVNVRYTPDRHGRANGAFLFDGKKGYVRVSDAAELDTDEAFTLCAWVKPRILHDSQGNSCSIVTKWLHGQTGHGDYFFRILQDGRLDLLVAHREKEFVQDRLLSTAKVPTQRWSHVAASFDRGEMKLYLHGKLVASKSSKTVRHTSRREYEHDDVHLGAKYDGTFRFDGAIDEVGIFDRALGAAEIGRVRDGRYGPTPLPKVTRLQQADRVAMANGDVLMGTIRNERHILRTFFGEVDLPAARVAGLAADDDPIAARAGGAGVRVRLVLTDGQVLAGALADGTLRLKLAVGGELRVPLGKVRQCGYRILRAKPAAPPWRGPGVTLRSGERLALAEPLPKLSLLRDGGTLALPPESFLAIEPAGPWHRVRLRNGSTLSGTLRPRELSLKLKFGPAPTVPVAWIQRLESGQSPVSPAGGYQVRTRRGDRLLGRLADATLAVRTRYGEVAIPPGSARSWAFDADRPGAVVVTLWNGSVLRGTLARPVLTFEMAPGGPTVKLRAERIASISRAGSAPADVARRVEELVGRLASPSFRVRKAAGEALVQMGPRIAPELQKHLKHPSEEVRERLREILKALQGGGKPAPAPRPGPIDVTVEIQN